MTGNAMQRREFLTLLGTSAAAWPLAARAQQPAMPVIGFLHSGSPEDAANTTTLPGRMLPLRKGLAENGYIEGRNVAIEYRWAEGHYDRLPTLAAELVRRQVAVIAALGGTSSAQAAKASTSTIPIVFVVGADPVGARLVTSLARPGGTLTGVVSLNVEVGQKLLEILREAVPTSRNIAFLINPINPSSELQSNNLQAAARTLGLQVHVLHASTEGDFAPVFASLAHLQARALVIGTDGLFSSRSPQLAGLTLSHGMPSISPYREFATAGGLMSYGGNTAEGFRLVGLLIGRILKGDRPADLPVQQATRIELTINLKTAKALGLTLPITLLGRADEVIE